MAINADKPKLWKNDVERSIDFYNDWFLRFAPETYRQQRRRTTTTVADALKQTTYLRDITSAVLVEQPGALSILRMVCAPPLARDRLIGLAQVNKNLVMTMEGKPGKSPRIPPRMDEDELQEQLQRICETITELADRDLFPWLGTQDKPSKSAINRAATVVADRLCGAISDPIIRNAQEQRQLAAIKKWLDAHGYTQIAPSKVGDPTRLPPGSYAFRLNIDTGRGRNKVNVPVDCVVQPLSAKAGAIPVLIEAKSAGDATNTNKRRKEEAQKYSQLKKTFGKDVVYVLFLCGYFEPGYLGYEASEGIDWIWEHRINDFEQLLAVDPPPAGKPRVREAPAQYVAGTQDRESARKARQDAVDHARTPAERNKLGQFSTPFALATDIVKDAVRHHPETTPLVFLEPAVGTGVFFSALSSAVPANRIHRAVGIEIDKDYAEVTTDLWPEPPFEVLLGDFIEHASASQHQAVFNLLCTNPPYVRHHHLESTLKRSLQSSVQTSLGIHVSGLSGLYVYFVLLADRMLASDGVASWLIPSEFLYVNYGKALREYFLNHVTLLRLHRFDPADVQFEDALVSSCVVTYAKKRPQSRYTFEYTYGGTLEEPSRTETVSSDDPSLLGKWNFNGQSPADDDAVSFGDLFDIKRGIATGANSFFIIDAESANEYQLPHSCLTPILPSPRNLKTTLIESDSEGVPALPTKHFLLDCQALPEVVRSRYPNLWAYIKRGEDLGITEKYLCANRKVWYFQERRDPPLYLATYMARSRNGKHPFRFFLNLSKAIATNVFLMLYPKPGLSAQLQGHKDRMLEMLALLSDLKPEDMINGGRTYGGGLHKLEPKELANIRLHNLPDWAQPVRQQELMFA